MSFSTTGGKTVTIIGGKYKGRDGVISCSMDCYYYVMLSPHCCGNGVCSEVRVWKSNVKFLKRSTGHCAGEVPVVPAKAVEYNDKCNEDVMVELMAV